MVELVTAYPIIFLLLLFWVAFLYASVGHGGASGYLALMALFGVMAPAMMKSSALIMNIFVSSISFFHYYKAGHFRWRLFFPFAIASIPMAFLGGYVILDPLIYKRILGVILIFPILRFFGIFGKTEASERRVNLPLALLVGGIIGLLSALIGIGGGIILSPVILLLHWGNMKQTAAVSALFILVNSAAGLSGMFSTGIGIDPSVYLWVAVALAGGFAGAYYVPMPLSSKSKCHNSILPFIL